MATTVLIQYALLKLWTIRSENLHLQGDLSTIQQFHA